jgi:hypothetical protein
VREREESFRKGGERSRETREKREEEGRGDRPGRERS